MATDALTTGADHVNLPLTHTMQHRSTHGHANDLQPLELGFNPFLAAASLKSPLLGANRAQAELRPSSGRAQAELRPSSGRAQVELRSSSGRAQVELRSSSGRAQVERRLPIERTATARDCLLGLRRFASSNSASALASAVHPSVWVGWRGQSTGGLRVDACEDGAGGALE